MVCCLTFSTFKYFFISGVTSSKNYPVLILNVILFSNLLMCILIEELIVFSSSFFSIYLKQSWISDKECDLSGNSISLFHIGADILNLLFLLHFLKLYLV